MKEKTSIILDRNELREWLENNHNTSKECYVKCKRGKPEKGIFSYIDCVEEALCFGWIDSTCKTAEDGFILQRLSPRRKNGRWTELNKERARRMERLGLMTDAGREALPDMSTDLDFLFPDLMKLLNKDQELLEYMEKLPALYIRIRLDGIQWAKSFSEKDYKPRLEKFIAETKKGKIYGIWDDYGRLS